MENEESNLLISPVTALAHEAGHAVGHMNAIRTDSEKQFKETSNKNSDLQNGTKEDRRVITKTEQYAARKHGEIVEGQQTRTNHEGHPFPLNMKSFTTLRSIMEFVSNYNSNVNSQSRSN